MDELLLLPGGAWTTGVLLVATRLAALLLLTPLLYAMPLPATVRLLLVLALSAGVALPLAPADVVPAANTDALFAALSREAAIGATLGLGVMMAFAGFALAGRLLDVQIGFGMGQVLDPLTRTQLPVITSMLGLAGVVCFFLVDGHHALLRGFAFSLQRFPPGRAWDGPQGAGPVLQQVAALFALGFALAAPVVLSLLLVEFVLGVLARSLPQANLFLLGLPVKVAVGLLALSFWATAMGEVNKRLFGALYGAWAALFEGGR